MTSWRLGQCSRLPTWTVDASTPHVLTSLPISVKPCGQSSNMHFKTAWKDGERKQSTYEQLMKPNEGLGHWFICHNIWPACSCCWLRTQHGRDSRMVHIRPAGLYSPPSFELRHGTYYHDGVAGSSMKQSPKSWKTIGTGLNFCSKQILTQTGYPAFLCTKDVWVILSVSVSNLLPLRDNDLLDYF